MILDTIGNSGPRMRFPKTLRSDFASSSAALFSNRDLCVSISTARDGYMRVFEFLSLHQLLFEHRQVVIFHHIHNYRVAGL